MCLLRYAEHKLFVRPTVTGQLCVLMASSINLPALKMAVNLARGASTPSLPASRLPSAARRLPPAGASPPAHPQIYRGNVVKKA